MYPTDILEHYRKKELARQFDPGLMFPQHSMIKKDWMEENAERYQKQFTMFGNLTSYNSRDIQKRENVTMYYCPVTSCNYTSEVLKSVKQHLSSTHISQRERQKFKQKQKERGFKSVNHLKKRL